MSDLLKKYFKMIKVLFHSNTHTNTPIEREIKIERKYLITLFKAFKIQHITKLEIFLKKLL